MSQDRPLRVLVTGVGGVHARTVAMRLLAGGAEVLGLDRRPWREAPAGITCFQADLRKRPAADVFRVHRPDVVVHMGTVTHFEADPDQRSRINLRGTQAVIANCVEFGVRRFVFISRHTIYGAASDTPLLRTEDEPPLAATTFPDLADLVAADLYASSTAWRHPELETIVLRMVYLLGPSGRGTLADFLRGPRVPMVLGFDPLFQFMHEDDGARAVTLAATHTLSSGVYNVGGPQPVPLSTLCRGTKRAAVPIPEPLLPPMLGRFGFPPLSAGAVPHLKYPIVLDDAAFRRATGFVHEWDEVQVMRAFSEVPIPEQRRGLFASRSR
jgi:UDP-glucose 4-epimerase